MWESLIRSINRLLRTPRNQIILIALLIFIGISAEGLLISNYFQLSQNIQQNFTPASNLLPQISGLRTDILLLENESLGALFGERPDFATADALRASAEDRLKLLQSSTNGQAQYQPTIDSTKQLLTNYDTLITAFRNTPANERRSVAAATVVDLQTRFRNTEKITDDLYRVEEKRFFDASATAFSSVTTAQIISLIVATIIIAFGIGLVFVIRRTVQAEISRTSERLKVAAEVGRAASSLLSLDELFNTTLNLICNRFGYFSVSAYLVDEKGEFAILRAGTSEVGPSQYRVLIGSNSTIGYVTANNTYRLVDATTSEPANFRNEMTMSTRSELAVPLRQGGQVIGALDLQSLEAQGFLEEDISIIQTLADQIAVAIGNAAQFTREQARSQQLISLVEASKELATPQINLEATLVLIARRLMRLMKCDDAAVWLPVGRDEIELKAQINTPQNMGKRLKIGEGLAGRVYSSGISIKVNDYPTWEGRSVVFNDAPFHAVIAAPMKWQESVVGVLIATIERVGNTFSDDDVRLVELFASQAASVLENTNLLNESQERVGELFILNQLGQSIAAQTNLNLLFDAVRHEVTRATRTNDVYIALYDADTNIFEIPYMFGNNEVTSIAPMPLGKGLTSIIIKSRKPLLINNEDEAAKMGAMIGGNTGAAQSYLGVPMIVGDVVLGVLAIQDMEVRGRFSESDVRFLETVGTQVGVAIQNARLYAQIQRRADQLLAAAEVSRASISITNPNELIVRAVELIRERFDLYYAALFLVDEESKWADIRHATGDAGQELLRRKHRLEIGGKSMVGSAISARQARIALDVGQESVRFANPLLPDTHSEMALPLRVGNTVLGALDVQSVKFNAFSEADITVLQTMADQVAIALRNANLIDETQTRLKEIATLNRISQAISSQTDLRSLFDAVRQEVMSATGSNNIYFALYDEQSNTFDIPYMYEDETFLSMPSTPLGQGLTSHIIQTQKSLLTHNEQETISLGVLAAASKTSKSYLGVPMIIGNNVIGVIAIQDLDEENRYNEFDLRLMETIASQVSVAIQNTQLFEQTKRRAEELAAINRIAEAARTALDIPSMLKSVAREVVSIFNASRSAIALLDPSGESLTILADYARNENEASVIGVKIPMANNPSNQQVFETQQVLAINDALTNPLTASMQQVFREHDVQSLMLVPLIVRGEVIGTIGIDSNLPDKEFKAEEVSLAKTLAVQVSSAIENTRLYQQGQRRAAQLLAAAEVSRAAISITDPDKLVIETINLIRERFDLYYAALFLIDETGEWAVLQYATGSAGEELLRRKHRFEIGRQSSMVATAIAQRQARIALDVGAEAVRFANPLLPDTHSEMALPLSISDTMLGALDVQSTEYNAFSEGDIAALQTMTDQLAIAIQNARLFLQTQRRAELERQINQATNKIRRAVDADSIMATVLTELNKILNTKRATAKLGPENQLLSTPTSSPNGDNGLGGNGKVK